MKTTNYEVVEHDESEVEHVVLETKPEPSNVVAFPSGWNLEWLMRDVASTPYAEVRS